MDAGDIDRHPGPLHLGQVVRRRHAQLVGQRLRGLHHSHRALDGVGAQIRPAGVGGGPVHHDLDRHVPGVHSQDLEARGLAHEAGGGEGPPLVEVGVDELGGAQAPHFLVVRPHQRKRGLQR